jgi:hypothetical protein
VSSANGKPKPKIQARYYPPDEWKKLTPEERAKVTELKKK